MRFEGVAVRFGRPATKQYSGFVPVTPDAKNNLFYYFVEADVSLRLGTESKRPDHFESGVCSAFWMMQTHFGGVAANTLTSLSIRISAFAPTLAISIIMKSK